MHDIRKLGKVAENYSEELLKAFPQGTSEQIECFGLLMKAYTEARYNKNGKAIYKKLWGQTYPHSIGLFYSAMTTIK